MKVAVIDLGTNTFNLLIAENSNSGFKILFHTKIAVMLGNEGILNGLISELALERAYQAIKDFHQIMQQHNCKKIKALGTSAIRSAKNSHNLISRVKTDFNIKIEPITGDQEAIYIYYGARAAVNFQLQNYLLLDIGGGSNEFILANKTDLLWKHSFQLGGARMLEKFQPHDPVLNDEITNMQNYFEQELQLLRTNFEKNSSNTLVGCSGAFDCFAGIIYHKKFGKPISNDLPGFEFSVDEFSEMASELIGTNRNERLQIKGLDPVRVDTIVMATIFTQLVLKITKIENIIQSAYSLKEGVATQILK